jgi:co-chaperonin GroES (HSP10)
MKIIPLNDNVLIKLIIKDKTAGGIVLPGDVKVQSGTVEAIGADVPSGFVYTEEKDGVGVRARGVKVGDKVFLPKGDKLGDKFQETPESEDIYLLLPHKFVGAVLEGDE